MIWLSFLCDFSKENNSPIFVFLSLINKRKHLELQANKFQSRMICVKEICNSASKTSIIQGMMSEMWTTRYHSTDKPTLDEKKMKNTQKFQALRCLLRAFSIFFAFMVGFPFISFYHNCKHRYFVVAYS